jgi:hypothetical protein
MQYIVDQSCSSNDARVRDYYQKLNISLILSQPLAVSTFIAYHHCVCSSKYTHATGRISSMSFISARENENSVNSGVLEAEIRHFDIICPYER